MGGVDTLYLDDEDDEDLSVDIGTRRGRPGFPRAGPFSMRPTGTGPSRGTQGTNAGGSMERMTRKLPEMKGDERVVVVKAP